MGKITTVIYSDSTSVVLAAAVGWRSGLNAPSSAWLHKPRKHASFMVVMQQFFQPLLSKGRMFLAHLSFSYNDGSGSDASDCSPGRCAIIA